MIVTLEDVRAVPCGVQKNKNLCVAGIRRVFQRNNWDWEDFLKNGKELEEIAESGHWFVKHLREYMDGRRR